MKTARDKLVSVATKLFYQRGINSVGIDEIVRRSDVAKMTLYKHFPSKDALAAAFLKEIHQQWSSWFFDRVGQRAARMKTPEERVLVIFDVLQEWFKTPDFRGCPFINTVAELADRNHPVRQDAVSFKKMLLENIKTNLRPLGCVREEELAVQFLLLIDGAIVRAAMTNSAQPAKIARRAAAQLLAQR
jgi:AcrR family transcriptional regulator